MTKRLNSSDYLNLFLNDVPLMDVRAPVEYQKGSFPCSINRPLLDDNQRHEIGICYKHKGEESAIAMGLEMATPEIRSQRYKEWREFCDQNPTGFLYCFRGGLRSRTTQQWIKAQGIEYPLVTGGYKAMRRYLIDELEISLTKLKVINIGGPTGSGKTRILKKINHHVDFEGIAKHRGSAFGRNPLDSQPSNIDWENAVSIAFLKHRHNAPNKTLFVEDESKLIGRVCMPQNVADLCKTNELVLLEESLDNRVEMTKTDYIDLLWPEYQSIFNEHAEQKFSDYVLNSLDRISKRLGGVRHSALRTSFEQALKQLFNSGRSDLFQEGIHILLADYYDPMYNYQLEQRAEQVVFKGNNKEVIAWANAS